MDMSSLAVSLVFVASMLVVGRLARERGRRSLPWVVAASIVGPLAIAALYAVDAVLAARRWMTTARP